MLMELKEIIYNYIEDLAEELENTNNYFITIQMRIPREYIWLV